MTSLPGAWAKSGVEGSGPDRLFQAASGLKAAIWAPDGPVDMPGGDLLTATGNSDERHGYDGSNAVVRLTPSLVRTDVFAPSDLQHSYPAAASSPASTR